jgi:hypothetical protein
VSALEADGLELLVARLASLTGALLARGDAGVREVEQAAADAWHYEADATRVDLGTVLSTLAASSASAEVRDAATRAALALAAAIVDGYASDEAARSGLSVFFPRDARVQWDLRRRYRDRFGSVPQETGWSGLLRARLALARADAASCSAAPPPALLVLLGFTLRGRRRRS